MATLGDSCSDRASVVITGGGTTHYFTKYPFTVDAHITSFCVYTPSVATLKLKVFRVSGSNVIYVGQSENKLLSAGANTGLSCDIYVNVGDYIGFYVSYSSGVENVDMDATGSYYLSPFRSGDITSDSDTSAWNAQNNYSVSLQVTYTATLADIYIDINKADDTGIGTSWATAKKTMKAGWDILSASGTMHVATGNYSIQTGITYNKSWKLSPEDPNTTGEKRVAIPPSV